MKQKKYIKSLFSAAIFGTYLTTPVLFAQDRAGNGGDGVEVLFSASKRELQTWVQKTEAKDLDFGAFDRLEVLQKLERAFTEVQVDFSHELQFVGTSERTCKNYPERKKIVCNRERFVKELELSRMLLVFHEYLGVIGVETNKGDRSDYLISEQIRPYIEKKELYGLGYNPHGGKSAASLEERRKKNLVFSSGTNAGKEIEFIAIPAGSFVMGDAKFGEWNPEEVPRETVLTNSFEIQATEVTQRQYHTLMGTAHLLNEAACDNFTSPMVVQSGLCPSFPATQVTWYQVQRFIEELNLVQSEYEYRLPTEAEWEYAARRQLPDDQIFSHPYRKAKDVDAYAWWSRNAIRFIETYVHANPVALKQPSVNGLYDVDGNVSEWVQDVAAGASPDTSHRAVRGGSFLTQAWADLRLTKRTGLQSDQGYAHVGFRLVRTKRP